jgi:hypothetical protein
MNFHLFRIVDFGVFVIANVINLLLVLMFVARARKAGSVEKAAGLIIVALALPLSAAALLSGLRHRSWWTWLLPLFMIVFCVVEYIVDYAMRIEFRNRRAMKPYLIIFYLALMSMIGYSFLLGKTYGYVTLATYFLHMAATAYSYGKVKHGG